MEIHQETFTVRNSGRGTTHVTRQVAEVVAAAGHQAGLCHVFCHHTSASLAITENADPTVRADLERYMARAVPDGDPMYQHDMEGPDDMAAHIRCILTGSGLTVPIIGGRLGLGTWQGIFLWEHRSRGHSRKITVTCLGG